MVFETETAQVELRSGRGLHSCTYRLDMSTFCGMSWVVWVVSETKAAQVEQISGRVEDPAACCATARFCMRRICSCTRNLRSCALISLSFSFRRDSESSVMCSRCLGFFAIGHPRRDAQR